MTMTMNNEHIDQSLYASFFLNQAVIYLLKSVLLLLLKNAIKHKYDVVFLFLYLDGTYEVYSLPNYILMYYYYILLL
jgi:hypothetical protein